MSEILVVIDMQNDFIDGALGTKEAQLIVPNVVKKIQDFDGDIYYTKDSHFIANGVKTTASIFKNYLDSLEGKNLPVPHCIIGTTGHDYVDEVENAIYNDHNINNIQLFLKNTFGSKQLAETIRNNISIKNIESIEFIGVCTDICIVSNVLMVKAFCPETPLIVDASCCAGSTPARHKAALEVMKSCQVEIINE